MEDQRYNYYKKEHPDWSDEQIWSAISHDIKAKEAVKASGGDIDGNDPDIVARIVSGAKKWLESILPDIFEKVKDIFDQILDHIYEWAKGKIEDILINRIPELIGNLLNKR